MRKINQLILAVSLQLAFLPIAFSSVKKRPEGIGKVANTMMDPVTLFSDMVYTGCLVIGASFLFAAIVKYVEHKRSPLMVPMSTVVFLVIAGLLLLLLPFLSLIDGNAVQYTFFKR